MQKIALFALFSSLGMCVSAQAQNVQISDLDAMNMGTWLDNNPSSNDYNLDLSDNICAYRDDGNGNYRITITGTNDIGTTFYVDDGFGNQVQYDVLFDRTAGSWITMQAGVAQDFDTANITASDCSSGGLSAKLRVRALDSYLSGKPSGTYSDTLTIVMEPR